DHESPCVRCGRVHEGWHHSLLQRKSPSNTRLPGIFAAGTGQGFGRHQDHRCQGQRAGR
ncbi:unnamed protein product, partial [Symbiodinium sp. KB8]